MKLTLYSRYRNSAGQRVRTALNLKGLAYAYVPIGEIGWQAYREINPQGLLPALEVDGQVLAQSTAIIEFLEDCFPEPRLLPADPLSRARARAFAQLVACEIHPIHNHRVRDHLKDAHGWTEARTMDWYRHWMREGLAILEAMLHRRDAPSAYCYGDRPSLADIFLVPQVYNARWFGLDLTPYPLVTAVDAACRALPAFDAAMPENQPDFPDDPARDGS